MQYSKNQLTQTSKFLSYVLRHKPDAIGLELDSEGWVAIDELISKANVPITEELLKEVVITNDKQRFAISKDGKRIRANQGHSVKVDLQLKSQQPPDILYHGTASRFLDDILKEGLKPKQRQHVHLSSDTDTAIAVGQRYGEPVVLTVNARKMYQQGYKFFLSKNNVWLTESVPPSQIHRLVVKII